MQDIDWTSEETGELAFSAPERKAEPYSGALRCGLKVTGLGDYILTEEERAVLEAFRNGKISWGGGKTP